MVERSAYRVLVEKSKGRRSLGRSTHRWEDIMMEHLEVGWGSMDWINGSGYGQVAISCECGNELSGSKKCGEFLDQLRINQLPKKNSAP
jgi:hypothetical protein